MSDRDEETAEAPPSSIQAPAPGGSTSTLVDGLATVAASLAIAHVALVAGIALLRARYPFELEWMEGACADHVARVRGAGALYERPSLEHVPLLYAPLWFYVTAAAGWVVGPGLFAGRLVSIAASGATLVLLYRFASRETGSRAAGLVAAGLYASAFRLAGSWFDVGRVDALFVALIVGAAYALRFAGGWRAAVIAGALTGLAFLTKQLALVPAAALLLAALPRPRIAAAFGASAAAVGGLALLALDRMYDGWLWRIAFVLPSRHTPLGEPPPYWTHDLLASFAGPCALAAALLVGLALARRGRALWFHAAWLAGMLVAGWLGRRHPGGWDNVLLPAFAALALAGGTALGHALAFARDTLASARAERAPQGRAALAVLAALVCVASLARRLHDPRASLPTAADRAANERVDAAIRAADGEVLVLSHGGWSDRHDRGRFLHLIAWLDLWRADPELFDEVTAELKSALDAGRFAALVLDSPYLVRHVGVAPRYAPARELQEDDAGWPITGRRTRPETLYLPSK